MRKELFVTMHIRIVLRERGSNENANKLIRRFIAKGKNIDKYTDAEIKRIEDWINNYPRKMFNYKTANQVYNECSLK